MRFGSTRNRTNSSRSDSTSGLIRPIQDAPANSHPERCRQAEGRPRQAAYDAIEHEETRIGKEVDGGH
jgi:hypothetical protein